MKKYNIQQKYNSICLISSCSCNLNCNYCVIAKSAAHSKDRDSIQQKTIQAFQDGTFLNNVVNTYQQLGQDLLNITCLNMWGQEPTLTLPYLTEHLEDWFLKFPNINFIEFSTNGGTDPNILYNFITKVDNIINHGCRIHIQISYDGEWSCLHQRLIKPELIKNNIKTLLGKLNETLLKRTIVKFEPHGVLNFPLIKHLMETDTIADYLIELDNTCYDLQSINLNRFCDIGGHTLSIEQPYKASSDDGMLLYTFLKKSLMVEKTLNLKRPSAIHPLLVHTIGGLNEKDKVLIDDKWKGNLQNTLNNSRNIIDTFWEGTSCGSYRTELKFKYDGTIVGCQNLVFDTDKNTLNETDSMLRAVKESLLDHDYYINLINDSSSEESIKANFKIFDTFNSSFMATYQSIINMMIFLAEAGQIDNSYITDKDKLFRHALIVSRQNPCFYNHLTSTGSHYLESTGVCRLLCNGVIDLAEQEYFLSYSQREECRKEFK